MCFRSSSLGVNLCSISPQVILNDFLKLPGIKLFHMSNGHKDARTDITELL